jgi:hypothetical protein
MLLLVVAGSAVAQDVRYNFDKEANFSGYKTFKWVPIKGSAKLSDMVDKQIQAAFEAEFTKKGLSEVTSDTADLYIGYQAAISQEKEYSSYSSDFGYGGGYGRGWYGGGGMGSTTTTGQTSTIYIGQLAIDMYDVAKKTLVWRGVASKTLDQKAKPEKQQKNLAKAIAKMLKNYPPPVKK